MFLKRCSFSRWFEMTGLPVRNAWPSGGGQVGPHTGGADDSRVPADAGAHQEPVFSGNVTPQHFAVFRAQPFRGDTGRLVEHVHEFCALQSEDPKFRQQLLLADAQAEGAARQVIRLIVVGRGLNDALFMVRRGGRTLQ